MKQFIAILIFSCFFFVGGEKSSAFPACPEEHDSPWDDCIGTFIYNNGDKYVGEFKEGARDGKGKYTYTNGNKYIGQWTEGKKNGKGEFTFSNGNKYIGDFVNGNWTGKGTLTNFFGDRYIGDFKDGKRHGKGIISSLNGFTYEGVFSNDYIVYGKGRVTRSAAKTQQPRNVCPGARNAKCPQPFKEISSGKFSLKPNRGGFAKPKE